MNILIISTVGLKYEGITSVIVSNLKAMNREGFKIYLVGTVEVHPDISKEIVELGCKLVSFPSRRENTIRYFLKLLYFIRKNKIDVVHAHGNSATLSIDLLAAFLGGCKVRIAHSHNTKCKQVKADQILHPLFNVLYTNALACGSDAGYWLFKDKKFDIINNGRNIESFQFNKQIRNDIRKAYQIRDRFVIGHVGGFLEQKNHVFLVNIFEALRNIRSDITFFMIGEGELRPEIERLVHEKGLDDCVVFTGILNNISALLQGMDGMLLPSKYEGLPLVAIEWQIAGLPCVLSDVITKECKCTDLVTFCSLEQPPEEWAEVLLSAVEKNNRETQKEIIYEAVQKAGFDIRLSAEKLRKLYLCSL